MLQISRLGLSMVLAIMLITPLSLFAAERDDFDDDVLKKYMTNEELSNWQSADKDLNFKITNAERDYKRALRSIERLHGKQTMNVEKTVSNLNQSIENEMAKFQKEYRKVDAEYKSQNSLIGTLKQDPDGEFPGVLNRKMRLRSNIKWPHKADKLNVIKNHAKEMGNSDWGAAWSKSMQYMDTAEELRKKAEYSYRNTRNRESNIQRVNALNALLEGNQAYVKMLQYQLQAYKIRTEMQQEVALSLISQKAGNKSATSELSKILEIKEKAIAEAEAAADAIRDKIRNKAAKRAIAERGWVISNNETLLVHSKEKLRDSVTLGDYDKKSSGNMKMSEAKNNTWLGKVKVVYDAQISNASPSGSILEIKGDIEIQNNATLTFDATSSDIVVSGSISSSAGDAKIVIRSLNGNKVVFSSASKFGGAIEVERGILQAEHEDALGSAGSSSFITNTVVKSGATLSLKILGAPVIRNEFFVISGDGEDGKGAIHIEEGNITFKSKFSLDGNSTIDVAKGATAILQQAIAGPGDLKKEGLGKLELSAPCEYEGTTTIRNGIFALGSSNIIPDSSEVIISGGVLDMNGYSDTFTTLSITQDSTIDMGNKASELTISKLTDASLAEYTLAVHNYTGDTGSKDGPDMVIIKSHLQFSKLGQIKFFKDEGISIISNTNGFHEDGEYLVPFHEGPIYTDKGFWFIVIEAIDMIALALSGLVPLTWYLLSKFKKKKKEMLGEDDDEEWEEEEENWSSEDQTASAGTEWQSQWVQAEDGQWVIQDENGNWVTEDGSLWQPQDPGSQS